jgi:hypothetical protein
VKLFSCHQRVFSFAVTLEQMKMKISVLKNYHCRFAFTFVFSPLNKWLGKVQRVIESGKGQGLEFGGFLTVAKNLLFWNVKNLS